MARRRLGLAWVVLVLAMALASCVSPEELRHRDEATCAGYGFHPSTDGFANCVQKESLARRYWAAQPLRIGVGVIGGAGAWDRIGRDERFGSVSF